MRGLIRYETPVTSAALVAVARGGIAGPVVTKWHYETAPTLFSGWRDPWEQINAAIDSPLRELGFDHVHVVDGIMRFCPLPQRVLRALDELRELRKNAAPVVACLDKS